MGLPQGLLAVNLLRGLDLMRQEPEYLIIGSGRLARHLTFYLHHQKARIWFYSRSSMQELETLGTRVRAISEAPDHAIRLLLLRDDVLVPFCETNLKALERGLVVQCSGSLSILDFAMEIHSYHPLFTFPTELYPLEKYESIPFIQERGSLPFEKVFPGLRNPVHELNPEHKMKYHALTSSISNFISVIIQQFVDEREKMKLDIPTAYFQSIAAQALHNAFTAPKTCLTGPIARGDSLLIQKHLGALKDCGLGVIYQGILESLKPSLDADLRNILEVQ